MSSTGYELHWTATLGLTPKRRVYEKTLWLNSNTEKDSYEGPILEDHYTTTAQRFHDPGLDRLVQPLLRTVLGLPAVRAGSPGAGDGGSEVQVILEFVPYEDRDAWV